MTQQTDLPTEILFLCLARDCESSLPHFFQYLKQLRSTGVTCRAFIGENGSRDRTRKIIVDASEDGITLLDTSEIASVQCRLARMALGRQLLLDAALIAEPPTFICVADLDKVMDKPPEIPPLRLAMERLRDDLSLFAIGATSNPVYYDLLALRTKDYDFSTLNAEIANAKKRPLSYHHFHLKRIYRQQKAVRALTTTEAMLCDSTFNGFCLYRAADYLLGSYRDPREAETCEHVSMNLSIARATERKMMITPDLVIQAPADHAPVSFARFWFDRLSKVADRWGKPLFE